MNPDADDFRKFVTGIRFDGCRPDSRDMTLPRYSNQELITAPWLAWPDAAIAELAFDDLEMKRRLATILDMHRMSTFSIAAILNMATSRISRNACYLNIGTWHGFSLLAGMIGNADTRVIGVDNFSKWGGPRDDFLAKFNRYRSPKHEFHEADYQDYFAKRHEGPIGVYFYDGDHSFENQLEGLRLAEPYFSDDCVILVDDTNLPAPYDASMRFIEQSANTYAILLD